MSLYAIRHKPTGRLLPIKPYGSHKGGTHVTLEDKRAPRLFPTTVAAQNALRHWLRGRLTVTYLPPCGPDWADDGDYRLEVEPVADRVADDMEIIEVDVIAK